MSYPLVKFVESPDPAAAVRYDFNRAGEDGVAQRRVMAEGFTLGSPTLEGDPDAVGVAYGFRQPLIPQRLKGTKAEALAALSSLSRELLRQTNWLMVQLNATTAPVFLKIYRSGFAPLSLAEVYVDTRTGDPVTMPDTWDIQVPLVADAFAYGERITLDPVTITQAPDGTNPMRYVLPAIKGDAPTALRVTVTPTATLSPDGQTWLIGNLSGSADMTDSVIGIGTGDGFTAGTGTAAASLDANYFSGSYRAVTVAAATPNLLTRLSGNIPGVPPGRYKVLLRCEADAASGVARTYLFQLAAGSDAPPLPSVSVTVNSRLVGPTPDLFRGWVDLGDVGLPAGLALPPDVPVSASSPTSPFDLKIGTADGSAGAVRIDAFKLIPLDGQTVDGATLLNTMVEGDSVTLTSTTPGTWDGDVEAMWGISSSGDWLTWVPVLRGGFPVVDPAAEQNLLILVAMEQGKTSTASATVTTVNAQSTVDGSYHPRLLHLGDGT